MKLPADDCYTVAVSSGESEIRVLGSLFLAAAWPVESPANADALIAETRKRFHDATHVVYAWVCRQGVQRLERASDDGEPSGTGGRPVLAEIDRIGLQNVLVTVTRWFGGKKLGTGRLARAYAEAAAAALSGCTRGTRRPMISLSVVCPWPSESQVQKSVHEVGGTIIDAQYSDGVSLTVEIPRMEVARFRALIADRTAGQVVITTLAASDGSD